MIRFGVTGEDGSKSIGIGLSRENIQRLQSGQPIVQSLREMGIDGKILIMFGETEKDIMAFLSDFIGPNTEVVEPFIKTCRKPQVRSQTARN